MTHVCNVLSRDETLWLKARDLLFRFILRKTRTRVSFADENTFVNRLNRFISTVPLKSILGVASGDVCFFLGARGENNKFAKQLCDNRGR